MIIHRRCSICDRSKTLILNDDESMMYTCGVPLREIRELSESDLSILEKGVCKDCEDKAYDM